MIDMLDSNATNLRRVTYLVLDSAVPVVCRKGTPRSF